MTGTCLEARCIGTQQKTDTRDQSWTVWGVQVRQFSAFLSSGSGLCLRTLWALSGKRTGGMWITVFTVSQQDVRVDQMALVSWEHHGFSTSFFLGFSWWNYRKTTWSFVGATDQGKSASHAPTLQSVNHEKIRSKSKLCRPITTIASVAHAPNNPQLHCQISCIPYGFRYPTHNVPFHASKPLCKVLNMWVVRQARWGSRTHQLRFSSSSVWVTDCP